MSSARFSIRTADDIAMQQALLQTAPADRDENQLRRLAKWVASQHGIFEEMPNDFVVEICRSSLLLSAEADDVVFYQSSRQSQAFVILTGILSAYSKDQTGGAALFGRQQSGLLLERLIASPSRTRRLPHGKSVETAENISREGSVSSLLPVEPMIRSSSEPMAIHLIGNARSPSPLGQPSDSMRRSQSPDPFRAKSPLSRRRANQRGSENHRRVFGHFLGRLFEGQLFGEISLLKPGVRRDMTVVADEQTTLMVVDYAHFQSCAESFHKEDLHEKTAALEKLDIFKGWNWSLLFHMAHRIVKETFAFNSFIVRQGKPAEDVFFIMSGQATIIIHTEQEESLTPTTRRKGTSVKQSRELTTMSTGGIFGLGEMLLSMETYGLSLRANETTAVLRMRSDHLMSVVKKFHPETLPTLMDFVKQRNSLYENRIYDISVVSDLYRDGTWLRNVEQEETLRRDKLPPIMHTRNGRSASGTTTPRSPRMQRASSPFRSETGSPFMSTSPRLRRTPISHGSPRLLEGSETFLDPFSDSRQRMLSEELGRMDLNSPPAIAKPSSPLSRRGMVGRFDNPSVRLSPPASPLTRKKRPPLL
ncbi:uncharacterized protein [Oscarella lobularis]|uniref:uncharacterized protein n=1 Tax=Oscarella lobularis TaxID=121494 RepID=UPI00331397D0